MNVWIYYAFLLDLLILHNSVLLGDSRKHRSVVYNHKLDLDGNEIENELLGSSKDFIWYTQTVAAGDTAVLHCSFDAIFAQLRNGNIEWARESSTKYEDADPVMIAEGKKVLIDDRRYRVYRPHNSALSVLIIRRAKKRDAGIYRCNLAGSSTRQKFMALNVTESKIDAQTSPSTLKTWIGKDVTMWCNATGYPKPVVYWTREDRHRKLQDGHYQYWGSGLQIKRPTEDDTGIYACYLDNFVQPVVSYKFSVAVQDNPWTLDGYKMRFDSTQWYSVSSPYPAPVRGMSYLLMCETKGTPKPLPHVKWLRDGKRITNKKHFYIIEDRPDWRTGYTSSTLVIMRFVPRFQGNYTCVGSNVFRTKSQTFYVNSYLDKPEVAAVPDPKSTNTPVKPIGQSSLLQIDISDGKNLNRNTDIDDAEDKNTDVDDEESEVLDLMEELEEEQEEQDGEDVPNEEEINTTDDEDYSEGSGTKSKDDDDDENGMD